MIGLVQARRLLSLMAAATAIALPFHPDSARCAEPPTQEPSTRSASSGTQQGPDTVTIEAQRERELKRQISKFVSSAVFTYMYDSLERWNTPICPLVAGLSKERGEFLLARVSQIARDSRAPLAAEHCKPNLFVVVTDNPDLLVEKWSKRDRGMLGTCNGMGYVKAFFSPGSPCAPTTTPDSARATASSGTPPCSM